MLDGALLFLPIKRSMPETFSIRTYSPRTAEAVKEGLREAFRGLWLEEHLDNIFIICDELIKNGIKSNYKTILYWLQARKRFQEKNPDVHKGEIDEWLYQVFYSGENELIQVQFDRADRQKILSDLLKILEMEAMYIDHRMGRKNLSDAGLLKNLIYIKRFCKRHGIGVQVHIESAGDQLHISVSNDAPLLEEDLTRIQSARSTFREFQQKGMEEQFFLEHINTGGGGHGLGYPLMDSILTTMHLDPDTSLYLISATRTMILLNLPVQAPQAAPVGG